MGTDLRTIIEITGINNEFEIRHILKLFKTATVYFDRLEETDYEAAMSMFEAAQVSYEEFSKASEYAGKRENERVKKNKKIKKGYDQVFEQAFEFLKRCKPDYSDFDAKKFIVKAFNTIFSDKYIYYFNPETSFENSPTMQRLKQEIKYCQGVDNKYRHFYKLKHGYWHDEVYIILSEMDSDKLADGAIKPLLSLIQISTQILSRGDDRGVAAEDVLKKYGDRIYPCLIDLINNPESYRYESRGVEIMPLNVIQCLSIPKQIEIYRAYLEIGQRNFSNILPDSPESRKLLEEFEDSPYGRPYKPFWFDK